ncbi:MAG TPA: CBS domain-containing protein [Burkholderiaceae bacterium]
MYIGSVCTRDVAVCEASLSVAEAAKRMREGHVGDLVVVEFRAGEAVPVGIITDRDLVVEVMAKDRNPEGITVGGIMTPKLVTAYEGEQLDVVMERMRWSGIRRIPLLDSAGALVGVACLDDIVANLAQLLANVACVGKIQQREERIVRE